MKKYLSLILVFAFMLSMIPMSVSADVAAAELKSVTGAYLNPALTSGIYNYDVIVDDVNAALPALSLELNDNTSSYQVTKLAENLGDSTLVKVTAADQSENTYKFTYREPYESETTECSLIAVDSTTVRQNSTYINTPYTTDPGYFIARVTSSYNWNILVKFDFTNTNPNPFGTFTFSYYLRNNAKGTAVQIASLKKEADWTMSEATWENTFGAKEPMEIDTSSIVNYTVENNAGLTSCDISSIVKDKLLKGINKFTLVFSLPADNLTTLSSTDVQWHMYSVGAAKDNTKPTIKYNEIKKSSDASLKSIDVTGGIIDKVFDPDVYEYEIGVEENEPPTIKYALSNSHANVEYTPAEAIGETAIIKVTAQDGLTQKKYEIKLVSYEDFGISETGKVSVSNTYISNAQGKISDLTPKEKIKFNVSYSNFNVNNKKLTLVTVQKRNGILANDGIIIETIEVPTGMNTISSSEITLPNNVTGLTIEGYVYEFDEKVPLFYKASVPSESAYTPTITATDKILDMKTDGVNVIIYGKSAPDSLIPIIATHPNKELSAFKKTDTSAAAVYDIAKSDAEGIWEKSVKFPNTPGWYKVYIGGVSEGKEFLHASAAQKMSVVQETYDKIYGHEDTEVAKAQALTDIKTHLGLCDTNNTNDEIISLDNSVYNLLNEEDVISLLYNITKETYQTKPTISSIEDIAPFVQLYDKAVKLAKINAGIEISVADLVSEFSFTDLTSLLNTVVSTRVNPLNLSVLNKGVTEINSLYNLIKTNILFEIINYPENVGIAQNHIETYGNYLGFDFSSYTYISNKASVVQVLVNEGPYSTLSQITDKFSSLVSSMGIISVVGGGSTGTGSGTGSGSGAGGGGSFSPSITGGKTDAPKYTDDVVPQEENKVFNDVEKDHWAYEATKYLFQNGIISGTQNGDYEPLRSIKREEFAKILALAFNLKSSGEGMEFSDVSDADWYYEFVKIAASNGIINGIGDEKFGSGMELSRQDIAVMLARVLNLSDPSDELFGDDDEIADYAKDAVYTLKKSGILSGTGNGNFEPTRAVTRAECAKIVYLLIKE